MQKVRIAIISKRAEVIGLFSLEAENFGFSVEISDRYSADMADADLCVIDLLLIKHLPARLPRRIIVLDGGEEERIYVGEATEICYTPFPMRLKRLFSLYASLAFGAPLEPQTSVEERGERIVYFSRSQDGACRVRYNKKYISLSNYEMRLLEYLCRRPNTTLSRETLNSLLGATEGNIADVYVCRLRKKLEEADPLRVILTVRSEGYKSIIGMEWE